MHEYPVVDPGTVPVTSSVFLTLDSWHRVERGNVDERTGEKNRERDIA